MKPAIEVYPRETGKQYVGSTETAKLDLEEVREPKVDGYLNKIIGYGISRNRLEYHESLSLFRLH